jgi:hypothetical protein
MAAAIGSADLTSTNSSNNIGLSDSGYDFVFVYPGFKVEMYSGSPGNFSL